MSLLIFSPETSFVPKIVHNPNPKPSKLHNLKLITRGKTIGLKVSCKVKYQKTSNNTIEDFPALFYRELSFDIYRDDIVFKDPLNTFVGIENYKSIFWALGFHGRMFFKALWIDLSRVWQPAEDVIMVRWTVDGIPRGPWESCSRSRFDGTSEYKLDKNGLSYDTDTIRK
ncbi:hypothetical protein JHK84_054526 [Glycine max]|nr:hypothetical protein JHK84_054526 [Glycine max]KAH1196101.1 hypothetical protein GmHk_19G056448 [Glycine max]